MKGHKAKQTAGSTSFRRITFWSNNRTKLGILIEKSRILSLTSSGQQLISALNRSQFIRFSPPQLKPRLSLWAWIPICFLSYVYLLVHSSSGYTSTWQEVACLWSWPPVACSDFEPWRAIIQNRICSGIPTPSSQLVLWTSWDPLLTAYRPMINALNHVNFTFKLIAICGNCKGWSWHFTAYAVILSVKQHCERQLHAYLSFLARPSPATYLRVYPTNEWHFPTTISAKANSSNRGAKRWSSVSSAAGMNCMTMN